MKKFFKKHIWPILKLLPRAILFALITGYGYTFIVGGRFRLYVYLVGVILAISGFYIVRGISRKIRDWEYHPEDYMDEIVED